MARNKAFMDGEGRCYFLNEQGLCNLVLKYGGREPFSWLYRNKTGFEDSLKKIKDIQLVTLEDMFVLQSNNR